MVDQLIQLELAEPNLMIIYFNLTNTGRALIIQVIKLNVINLKSGNADAVQTIHKILIFYFVA